MKHFSILVALLMLTGCLSMDPAVRKASKQEEAAFMKAVANLRILNEDDASKFKCKSLGQVTGKGGMAPRTYEADMQHAVKMAKHAAVKASGNAIVFISSKLSSQFPKEVIVIARAFECKFSDVEGSNGKKVSGD